MKVWYVKVWECIAKIFIMHFQLLDINFENVEQFNNDQSFEAVGIKNHNLFNVTEILLLKILNYNIKTICVFIFPIFNTIS